MTIMQSDIIRYLDAQFRGCRYELIGDDVVRVTDKNGKIWNLTCNLFSDIMDKSTKQILATSDVPHDLNILSTQRPTKWVNNTEYFG